MSYRQATLGYMAVAAFGQWHQSRRIRATNEQVVLLALLFFEYCTTFDREVHYAWLGKPTLAKTIFLLNRYFSLLLYILQLCVQFQDPSPTVSYRPHSTCEDEKKLIFASHC